MKFIDNFIEKLTDKIAEKVADLLIKKQQERKEPDLTIKDPFQQPRPIPRPYPSDPGVVCMYACVSTPYNRLDENFRVSDIGSDSTTNIT